MPICCDHSEGPTGIYTNFKFKAKISKKKHPWQPNMQTVTDRQTDRQTTDKFFDVCADFFFRLNLLPPYLLCFQGIITYSTAASFFWIHPAFCPTGSPEMLVAHRHLVDSTSNKNKKDQNRGWVKEVIIQFFYAFLLQLPYQNAKVNRALHYCKGHLYYVKGHLHYGKIYLGAFYHNMHFTIV